MKHFHPLIGLKTAAMMVTALGAGLLIFTPPHTAVAVESEVTAPNAFDGIPGLTPTDPVAGMNAWKAEGSTMMYLQDPETGDLVAGFVFDAEGKALHPDLKEVENSGIRRMIEELHGPSISIPEAHAPTVEEKLSALPEAERKIAIGQLIEVLRGVEDEAAFNTAIEEWLEGIDAAGPEEVSLLDAARGSFWMQVGNPDAPVAYVFTDPACEPCRASTDLLREKVKAGELQLRVMMLSMVDENALNTIAGIIASEDPAGTFLAMSMETDDDFPSAKPHDLPDVIQAGLDRNYQLAEAAAIPQLPFYIFDTEEGPRYISGVPSVEQLKSALPPTVRLQPAAAAAAPEDGPGEGKAEE